MTETSKYILNPEQFGFDDKRAEEIIDTYDDSVMLENFQNEEEEVNFTLENICQTDGEREWFEEGFKLQTQINKD